MSSKKQKWLMSLVGILGLFCSFSSALADSPSLPAINETNADLTKGSLSFWGQNFGKTPYSVMPGNSALLYVTSSSPAAIVAKLPTAVTPDTYLPTAYTGKALPFTIMAVTIGAQGPQEPQGPQGPVGATGSTSTSSDQLVAMGQSITICGGNPAVPFTYLYDKISMTITPVKNNCMESQMFPNFNNEHTLLVYTESAMNNTYGDISIYNIASKTITPLTLPDFSNYVTKDIAAYFDNDGKIIFNGDGALKRMDVDGTNITTIATPESPYDFTMFWMSPDRNKIIVIENNQQGDDYDTSNYQRLVLMNSDGMGRTLIGQEYLGDWNDLSWQEDSRSFFYHYHIFNVVGGVDGGEITKYELVNLSGGSLNITDLSNSDLSKVGNLCHFTKSGNLLSLSYQELYNGQTGVLISTRPDVPTLTEAMFGFDRNGNIYFANFDGSNFRQFEEFAQGLQEEPKISVSPMSVNLSSVKAALTPIPKISVSPQAVNFGSVVARSTSNPETVTIKNNGNADLEIGSIVITGANQSAFNDTTNCGLVPAKNSCSITVTFTPNVQGTASAIMSISSNDPKKTVSNVKLSGKGTPNVTGTWIGSWSSSKHGNGGGLTCTFTQSGATLTGTIVPSNSSCFVNGTVSSGTVARNTVVIGVSFSASGASGTFHGTLLTPGTMSGTWQGRGCGGTDNGSFNMTLSTPPTCTSFTYSAWSACVNGEETRTVLSSSPAGCTGGNPVLTQSCTNTCTSFTYSNWSACVNGEETRTVLSSSPAGCTGGNPVLTQSCTNTCTSFTYSNWSACVNGEETRTVLSSSPAGCTGGNPVLTQSCTNTCTSFTYSNWSACVNGEETRTVLSSSPAGCTGGNPVLTQSCTTLTCPGWTPVVSGDLTWISTTSQKVVFNSSGTLTLYWGAQYYNGTCQATCMLNACQGNNYCCSGPVRAQVYASPNDISATTTNLSSMHLLLTSTLSATTECNNATEIPNGLSYQTQASGVTAAYTSPPPGTYCIVVVLEGQPDASGTESGSLGSVNSGYNMYDYMQIQGAHTF